MELLRNSCASTRSNALGRCGSNLVQLHGGPQQTDWPAHLDGGLWDEPGLGLRLTRADRFGRGLIAVRADVVVQSSDFFRDRSQAALLNSLTLRILSCKHQAVNPTCF